ncbi:CpsD/CapB family tyrosine-protein kinase [Bacillus sp. JJ1521]|uniref:CpsD/CapB family tyrosine-protein kinase n=1 Tax=Bacillus sp. JJ1521 TaxID=3122957 RepID=UPI003000BEEC
MILNPFKQNEIVKQSGITTHSFPESIISEQFRAIRTNLQFINGVNKNQTILVTSPGHSEGKSTIVANLAISLAQNKENVLLIDTNLKKPALHTIFNVENMTGLTDVLRGKLSLEETVVQTAVGRLDVLTSGSLPTISSDLIGSMAMFDLLQKASKNYNIVLIDSPPFLELSDTQILASVCDGVILVIKSGKTDTKKAIETKRQLDLAKAKIIGVVINEKQY